MKKKYLDCKKIKNPQLSLRVSLGLTEFSANQLHHPLF